MGHLDWCHPWRQLTVSPYFFLKQLTTLFIHQRLSVLQCHPYFSSTNWRPFLLIAVTLIGFHWGVTPQRVSPRTFITCLTSFCPLLFVNSATFFSFGCHSPGGCHPGRSPRDATRYWHKPTGHLSFSLIVNDLLSILIILCTGSARRGWSTITQIKSNMAAAADSSKNRHHIITLPEVVRFGWKLVGWCKMTCRW